MYCDYGAGRQLRAMVTDAEYGVDCLNSNPASLEATDLDQ